MSEEEKREQGLEAKGGLSRRSFLGVSGAAIGTLAVTGPGKAQAAASRNGVPSRGPGVAPIRLKINGKSHSLKVEPRTTLLSALRDQLEMTGTKVVCDRGACGGCTVQMDGKNYCSCMTLAIDAEGKEITTIEGLARGEVLHPIQAAFVEHDALQCGFCTPGMIMSVKTLLDHNPNPSDEEIREAVSGNLCRCGTYPRVFEAARTAADRMRSARVVPEERRA